MMATHLSRRAFLGQTGTMAALAVAMFGKVAIVWYSRLGT